MLFSRAHGMFFSIDHMLDHKTNLNKFKTIIIISSILSSHKRMRFEVNHERKKGRKTERREEAKKRERGSKREKEGGRKEGRKEGREEGRKERRWEKCKHVAPKKCARNTRNHYSSGLNWRLSCPSPSLGACSNSSPLSW